MMTKDELLKTVNWDVYNLEQRQNNITAVDRYTEALWQQANVSRSASILDQVKVKCRIENGSIIIDLEV
jgi:hypothetical protein